MSEVCYFLASSVPAMQIVMRSCRWQLQVFAVSCRVPSFWKYPNPATKERTAFMGFPLRLNVVNV